jgi:hypothetical protein
MGSHRVQTSRAQFWQRTYLPFITENLKPSSLHSYRQLWEQHLKPHFGATLPKDYGRNKAEQEIARLRLIKSQREETNSSTYFVDR